MVGRMWSKRYRTHVRFDSLLARTQKDLFGFDFWSLVSGELWEIGEVENWIRRRGKGLVSEVVGRNAVEEI